MRKALGVTDSDVLLQFLFEAVLLAALGGLAGLALGVGARSQEHLPDKGLLVANTLRKLGQAPEECSATNRRW